MGNFNRRDFLEILSAVTLACGTRDNTAAEHESSSSAVPPAGTYQPGRIQNEYYLYLPGERESLAAVPTVRDIATQGLTAQLGSQSRPMHIDDSFEGWRLLAIETIDGTLTAIFEKHVTHRGSIAFITERNGLVAQIPKLIGQLSSIRPRQISRPHGVGFDRPLTPGPDTGGEYILNSTEDPCYENVAAMGPEYIGWTLVANEEGGPQHSLYLDETGRSRQHAKTTQNIASPAQETQWAPDAMGALFDPGSIVGDLEHSHVKGYTKRTLLAGYLPIADIALWDPNHGAGYEVLVLLPPGQDTQPIGRMRSTIGTRQLAELEKFKDLHPEFFKDLKVVEQEGQTYLERYWNGSPTQFYTHLLIIWRRWSAFHESGMQVRIPDEWLVDAARAGLTLCRCSYTGLEPTYQVGEGGYTHATPTSDSLFPVAHYEFVWAHQLWNHTPDADRYFQHYLDRYVLPDGNFTYNTQDQVEAPLNVGVFLAISARSYFYARDVASLNARLPTLERMLGYVLQRYEYSKTHSKVGDRRRGLIWGSPEADLGSPKKDTPDAHPFFYQNAVWIWRGLHEHAQALRHAGAQSKSSQLMSAASRYAAVAREMRGYIESSLAATLSHCNEAMRSSGITPFTPDDTDRIPEQLSNYENHRFMEDWFLADWGNPALDAGHLKHRVLANAQIMGLGTSHAPAVTSNFMAHGTLSVLIRAEDYRPYLLALYTLVCYAADSGNRYAPEDAFMPDGHPLEGPAALWSAVVNSTLQPTIGLRWLLCYEESDAGVCHLQKAAPKHWFAAGETISVKQCPTRFGTIGWTTRATSDASWEILLDLPKDFGAELRIHVHPNSGKGLRSTSLGAIVGSSVRLTQAVLRSHPQPLRVAVST